MNRKSIGEAKRSLMQEGGEAFRAGKAARRVFWTHRRRFWLLSCPELMEIFCSVTARMLFFQALDVIWKRSLHDQERPVSVTKGAATTFNVHADR